MDTEKDFLKRDLGKAESKEEVEKLIEDAEMLGHEDVVELAKAKLEAISAKVKSVETTPPAQTAQVESMGGSADEVAKRTEGVDQKIAEVKAEAEQKVAEISGEKVGAEASPSETKSESVDKTLEQAEINEINSDIRVEELYISQAQEVIQRANYTIARNKEAQVDLNDQLGAMVSKSKTGFGFDFIDKPKQFGKYQMAGPAHGMISGEIGDGPMTLGEALEKGIKNYEEVVKTKEKEITEKEERIKNLKNKLEKLSQS